MMFQLVLFYFHLISKTAASSKLLQIALGSEKHENHLSHVVIERFDESSRNFINFVVDSNFMKHTNFINEILFKAFGSGVTVTVEIFGKVRDYEENRVKITTAFKENKEISKINLRNLTDISEKVQENSMNNEQTFTGNHKIYRKNQENFKNANENSRNSIKKKNVLFIGQVKSFIKCFEKILTKEKFENQGILVLVFFEEKSEISEEKLENEKVLQKVFEVMWARRIANVEIVLGHGRETVSVYSFLPFADKNCSKVTPVLIKQYKRNEILENLENFHSHKFKNLQSCPIRAGVTQNKPYIFKKESKGKISLSGREIELVKELSRVLNFKADFKYVNESGALHSNGTATGTFSFLISGKVDMILGNNNLKPNRLKFIENSTPYIASQITFLIPPGQPLTSFERLFSPLRFKVWICTLIYFLVGIFVIFLVNRQRAAVKNFVFGFNVKNPYMNMLNAVFGGSQEVEPRGNFARFLLTMFLVFCLVIRTLYCGSLYRFMQSDIHHSEVESIDEMLEKGFKFYVSTSSLDLYENDPKFQGRFVLASTNNKN